MKALKRDLGAAAAVAATLWAVAPVNAAEIRRLDGIHRIAKRDAQITDPAVLAPRDGSTNGVCGTGLKLCPASLDGGCCPSEYECGKQSCQATTRGPSTCGDKVGWYVCDAVYGAGACCPDGYLCETGDACLPPTGSPYTFGCPASQYLCPSEMNYGCCPNGMGCAKNQCYSTDPVTTTITTIVTTTSGGESTTVQATITTVTTPRAPTTFPTADVADNGNQAVLKFYPSEIAKVTPSPTAEPKNDNGGLSTGALAGIIAGSVAFLILVGVGAYIIIRHLNKVVAAVGSATQSKKSDMSKSNPTMKQYKPADSEGDTFSGDSLMVPTRPRNPGPEANGFSGSEYSSNNATPNFGSGGYHPVGATPGDSRGTSFDVNNNPQGGDDYFKAGGGAGQFRVSQQSTNTTPASLKHLSDDSRNGYQHVRHWSNASDSTDGHMTELDATDRAQELPNSPASAAFPAIDRRLSSGSAASSTARPSLGQQRRSSQQQQRGRSESVGQASPLGMVHEEIHGFYGPTGQFIGQTNASRPRTQDSGLDGVAPDERPAEGPGNHRGQQ